MRPDPHRHGSVEIYRRLRALVDSLWGRTPGRVLIMIKSERNLSPMREMPHCDLEGLGAACRPRLPAGVPLSRDAATAISPQFRGEDMRSINVGFIGTGWCGGIRANACAANPLVGGLYIAEIKPERLPPGAPPPPPQP